jgi:hypothetical protein
MIPAQIWTLDPNDPHKDTRIKLAQLSENLVRKQLSLLELCTYLGEYKAVYDSRFAQIWRYIPDGAMLWACMKYPTSSQRASTTCHC